MEIKNGFSRGKYLQNIQRKKYKRNIGLQFQHKSLRDTGKFEKENSRKY